MENIILSSANLLALPSIYYNTEIYRRWSIIFYMLSSSLYHLTECKKHDMKGIGILKTWGEQIVVSSVNRLFFWTAFTSNVYQIGTVHIPVIITLIILYFGCEMLESVRVRKKKIEEYDYESLEKRVVTKPVGFLRNLYVITQLQWFMCFYGLLFYVT